MFLKHRIAQIDFITIHNYNNNTNNQQAAPVSNSHQSSSSLGSISDSIWIGFWNFINKKYSQQSAICFVSGADTYLASQPLYLQLIWTMH